MNPGFTMDSKWINITGRGKFSISDSFPSQLHMYMYVHALLVGVACRGRGWVAVVSSRSQTPWGGVGSGDETTYPDDPYRREHVWSPQAEARATERGRKGCLWNTDRELGLLQVPLCSSGLLLWTQRLEKVPERNGRVQTVHEWTQQTEDDGYSRKEIVHVIY